MTRHLTAKERDFVCACAGKGYSASRTRKLLRARRRNGETPGTKAVRAAMLGRRYKRGQREAGLVCSQMLTVMFTPCRAFNVQGIILLRIRLVLCALRCVLLCSYHFVLSTCKEAFCYGSVFYLPTAVVRKTLDGMSALALRCFLFCSRLVKQ